LLLVYLKKRGLLNSAKNESGVKQAWAKCVYTDLN
jgi:hypothetical protein